MRKRDTSDFVDIFKGTISPKGRGVFKQKCRLFLFSKLCEYAKIFYFTQSGRFLFFSLFLNPFAINATLNHNELPLVVVIVVSLFNFAFDPMIVGWLLRLLWLFASFDWRFFFVWKSFFLFASFVCWTAIYLFEILFWGFVDLNNNIIVLAWRVEQWLSRRFFFSIKTYEWPPSTFVWSWMKTN